MDKEESSSTIDSLEGKMNTIRDEEKLDIVTALTTSLQQTVIRKHAETLKNLKSQEKEIRQQQQQIDELNFELSIKDAHMQNIKNETRIPLTPSLPPALAASETPTLRPTRCCGASPSAASGRCPPHSRSTLRPTTYL